MIESSICLLLGAGAKQREPHKYWQKSQSILRMRGPERSCLRPEWEQEDIFFKAHGSKKISRIPRASKEQESREAERSSVLNTQQRFAAKSAEMNSCGLGVGGVAWN